jgi:predicted secreted Zn-dependent protease
VTANPLVKAIGSRYPGAAERGFERN